MTLTLKQMIFAGSLLGALGLSAPLLAQEMHTMNMGGDMTMDMSGASDIAVSAPVMLGDIELTDGFTRAMPEGARAGGGFVTITNHGSEDDTLIAASSPAAGLVQLHEMKMENDVMIMQEKEGGIPVAAGATVHLQPGGLHIMFMQVLEPFVEGTEVPVTLVFEKAGEVDISLPVAPIGAKLLMGR